MKNVSVKLTDEQVKYLDEIGARKELNRSDMIREVINYSMRESCMVRLVMAERDIEHLRAQLSIARGENSNVRGS